MNPDVTSSRPKGCSHPRNIILNSSGDPKQICEIFSRIFRQPGTEYLRHYQTTWSQTSFRILRKLWGGIKRDQLSTLVVLHSWKKTKPVSSGLFRKDTLLAAIFLVLWGNRVSVEMMFTLENVPTVSPCEAVLCPTRGRMNGCGWAWECLL